MQGTEGSLEIVHQNYEERNATPKYKVMFSHARMIGGAQPGKDFIGTKALESYLAELDLSDENIKQWMLQLRGKRSISIPHVSLDAEHLLPFSK